jgi:hypothetical protein
MRDFPPCHSVAVRWQRERLGSHPGGRFNWYEGLTEGVATVGDCQVGGETVTCLNTYTDDELMAMGADLLEGEWVGIVRDGRIQSYKFTMTP